MITLIFLFALIILGIYFYNKDPSISKEQNLLNLLCAQSIKNNKKIWDAKYLDLKNNYDRTENALKKCNQNLLSTKGQVDTCNQNLLNSKVQVDTCNQNLLNSKGQVDTCNQNLLNSKGQVDTCNQNLLSTQEQIKKFTSCEGGKSYCPTANACISLINDFYNCGQCAKICDPGQYCDNFECKDPPLIIFYDNMPGGGKQIVLPILLDSTKEYSIQWGTENVYDIKSISYITNNTSMEVKIYGKAVKEFNQQEANIYIKEIKSYGNNIFNNIRFQGMINLVSVPPLPRNITSTYSMFINCVNLQILISDWDVSNVIDMSYMFLGCKNFNQDISMWDVSRVINMKGMFSNCTSFNQDLKNWDVSSVTDMSNMFVNTPITLNTITNTWGWNLQNKAITNITTL